MLPDRPENDPKYWDPQYSDSMTDEEFAEWARKRRPRALEIARQMLGLENVPETPEVGEYRPGDDHEV